MRAELVVGDLAAEERLGLGTEQFDVLANRAIVFVFNSLQVDYGISGSHSLFVYRDYHIWQLDARMYLGASWVI